MAEAYTLEDLQTTLDRDGRIDRATAIKTLEAYEFKPGDQDKASQQDKWFPPGMQGKNNRGFKVSREDYWLETNAPLKQLVAALEKANGNNGHVKGGLEENLIAQSEDLPEWFTIPEGFTVRKEGEHLIIMPEHCPEFAMHFHDTGTQKDRQAFEKAFPGYETQLSDYTESLDRLAEQYGFEVNRSSSAMKLSAKHLNLELTAPYGEKSSSLSKHLEALESQAAEHYYEQAALLASYKKPDYSVEKTSGGEQRLIVITGPGLENPLELPAHGESFCLDVDQLEELKKLRGQKQFAADFNPEPPQIEPAKESDSTSAGSHLTEEKQEATYPITAAERASGREEKPPIEEQPHPNSRANARRITLLQEKIRSYFKGEYEPVRVDLIREKAKTSESVVVMLGEGIPNRYRNVLKVNILEADGIKLCGYLKEKGKPPEEIQAFKELYREYTNLIVPFSRVGAPGHSHHRSASNHRGGSYHHR